MKKITIMISSLLICLSSLQAVPMKMRPKKEKKDTTYNLPYYTKDAWGVFVDASLLIWKPSEEGMDYAVKNNGGTSSISNGTMEDVDFDWDVGCKVGIGYQVPKEWMDLSLRWTHLHTDTSASTSAETGGILFSTWTVPKANLTGSNTAKADWHLNFNLLDFEVGAKLTPRPWLLFRPHVGLRTAWIYQNLNIVLAGGASLGPVRVIEADKIDMKNDFWGIGPRIGVNTLWGLKWGISFLGDIAYSLLYGHFDLKQDETVKFNGLQPASVFLNLDEHFNRGRSAVELLLGLRWDTMLCNDRYHLGFLAGWEQQYYFGQNQLRTFMDDINPGSNVARNGDLSFHGVTLSARFDF